MKNEKSCLYYGSVRGISFNPHKRSFEKAIEYFKKLDEDCNPYIKLVHEKDNQYDKNAIRVWIGQYDKKWPIGWIPKEVNGNIIEYGIKKAKGKLIKFNINSSKEICGATICVEKI